jgi:hypothetical protein
VRATNTDDGIPVIRGRNSIVPDNVRHTVATDAPTNGVLDAQVADLLGHIGTAMLHRHYAHLGAKAKALRDDLDRIR